LTGRRQCVQVGRDRSGFKDLIAGVPQGSLNGPLLFLIFANDLPLIINDSNTSLITYADDTSLIFTGDNFKAVQDGLEKHGEEVMKWFKANNMVCNGDKSNVMSGATAQKRDMDQLGKLTIKLSGTEIDESRSERVLGIQLQNDFRWDSQVDGLVRNLSFRANQLVYMKRYLHIAKRAYPCHSQNI